MLIKAKAAVKRALGGRTIVQGPKVLEHGPGLVTGLPTPQHALDIFRDEWISRLPKGNSHLSAGQMPLFEDPRVLWAVEQLGGLQGDRVLELGPLEAGHSYIAQQQGAREVIGIEGNARAFMKCLVMKEVLGLDRVHLLLGDFVEYMQHTDERFDTCFANGVLYHMREPARVVHLIARVARRATVWTHYYDEAKVKASASNGRFSGSSPASFQGFDCTQHRYEYGGSSKFATFAGGLHPHAHWMSRDDMLACFRHAGFSRIEIAFEEPDHVHGPCFALAVSR